MKSILNCARILFSLGLIFFQTQTIIGQINPQTGENIWHLVASIGTEVDTLAQIIATEFAGTFTAIAAVQCSAGSSVCPQTQLTTPITIATPGNYCMANDMNGTITIAASNVTLNMNGFSLDGIITVNAGIQNVIIQNGTIAPSSAAGNFSITNGAAYSTLQNLRVLPTSSDGGGISNTGKNLTIENCMIVPTGGELLYSLGINNTGSNIVIKNCIVSGATSTVAAGGDAINLGNAANAVVSQCIIPTTGNSAASSGANGGVGINNIGSDAQIIDCLIINTGSGSTGGGDGGAGMVISSGSTNCSIINCSVLNTGNGTTSGGTCVADSGSFTTINGCRLLSSATPTVICLQESGATGCAVTDCIMQQPSSTSSSNVGLAVSSSTRNFEASNCTFASISGLAINDTNSSGSGNVYYGNFAYDVTGVSGNIFVMPSDAAVDAPNGTAFTSAGAENRLANVHKP